MDLQPGRACLACVFGYRFPANTRTAEGSVSSVNIAAGCTTACRSCSCGGHGKRSRCGHALKAHGGGSLSFADSRCDAGVKDAADLTVGIHACLRIAASSGTPCVADDASHTTAAQSADTATIAAVIGVSPGGWLSRRAHMGTTSFLGRPSSQRSPALSVGGSWTVSLHGRGHAPEGRRISNSMNGKAVGRSALPPVGQGGVNLAARLG